jgi:hypothetical protein
MFFFFFAFGKGDGRGVLERGEGTFQKVVSSVPWAGRFDCL